METCTFWTDASITVLSWSALCLFSICFLSGYVWAAAIFSLQLTFKTWCEIHLDRFSKICVGELSLDLHWNPNFALVFNDKNWLSGKIKVVYIIEISQEVKFPNFNSKFSLFNSFLANILYRNNKIKPRASNAFTFSYPSNFYVDAEISLGTRKWSDLSDILGEKISLRFLGFKTSILVF